MAWPDNLRDNRGVTRATNPSVWNFVAAQKAPQALGDPFSLLDPETDLVWGAQTPERPPSSYFDYYYTGADVSVTLDGSTAFGGCEVPILEFGFSIQQQKQPVFGFWDYTYRQVMRGTRLVTGQFTIATTYPNRIADMIAESANSRVAQRSNSTPIRGLDIDEENIEQYWGRTRDPFNTNYAGRHVFSAHPPFNFVIAYGIQSASVTSDPLAKSEALYSRYQNDVAWYQGTNERLVDSNPDKPTGKRIIEMVELQQCQVLLTPEGDVCAEAYTFFARDLVDPIDGRFG